jgi:lysine 6-dehydrogenase
MLNSNQPFTYLILGAGRQGTAAAYDLAIFGEADNIIFADIIPEVAQKAADRVNRLVGKDIVTWQQLDVTNQSALKTALSSADVALSAVPYKYNVDITRACISSGTSLCDMGGHTGIVRQQISMNEDARMARVSVVPDCGMGPGLIITMAAYAMELLDEPQQIYIYDGGLPQNPQPPWNYQLTFHINGLTNEMDGQAYFIRDSKVTPVDTLTEPHFIEFPPLGQLEADVTSGGLSLSPWTFEGQLETYENRTLRYPDHFEWLRAFKSLGLFSEEPLNVDNQVVSPRSVFHTLLEPKITSPEIRDVCIIRVKGIGLKGKQETTLVIDLIDYYDEDTGFTAMERLTGWHCAIMMIFQAKGQVPCGSIPVERAVSPGKFMNEVSRRGIKFESRYK